MYWVSNLFFNTEKKELGKIQFKKNVKIGFMTPVHIGSKCKG